MYVFVRVAAPLHPMGAKLTPNHAHTLDCCNHQFASHRIPIHGVKRLLHPDFIPALLRKAKGECGVDALGDIVTTSNQRHIAANDYRLSIRGIPSGMQR